MSISRLELIDSIEKIAPRHLAEVWDNCGMQIDLEKENVNKILVSLEITKEVLREAKSLGVDFIITHHPLIFTGLKQIDSNDVTGNYIIDCINSGISVYSAHTNFDKAEKGNNYYLAELLELKDINKFEDIDLEYIGLYGELKDEIALNDVICKIKNKLELFDYEIKVVGQLDKKIKKVGLCTGSGIDMLDVAIKTGCQLFVTGDVKYHDAVKAKELNMNVIDAGHFGTEKIFVPNLCMQLKKVFFDRVEIIASKSDSNPFIKF